MPDKLVVIVLGNRRAGKSSTWNKVFGRRVRTGRHRLNLNAAEWVDVFLTSGSPEERKKHIKNILPPHKPTIVLCSVQYRAEGKDTLDFFIKNHYDLLVIWLNPGYRDKRRYKDTLGLIQSLIDRKAFVVRMNGKSNLANRSLAIRQFIYGWGTVRNLVRIDF